MKKFILYGLIGLILISGLIWSYLKMEEVSFKKELSRFESCLSAESDKCLQKVYDCNAPNDVKSAFDYDLQLEKKCDNQYINCLDNINCKDAMLLK